MHCPFSKGFEDNDFQKNCEVVHSCFLALLDILTTTKKSFFHILSAFMYFILFPEAINSYDLRKLT